MANPEIIIGSMACVAFYFFVAGLVAEHSCSTKHKDISSPIPSIITGLLWPLVAIKHVMIWSWGSL